MVLASFSKPIYSAALPKQAEHLIIDKNIQIKDQHGQHFNFFQDLIKNKTVAINFIFTDCTSSCSLSTAIFRQVQNQLGKKVQLITISVDPENDTPERLLEFSKKFNAQPGWAFVTGEKAAIVGILNRFGVYSPDKNNHSNLVIAGNEAHHQWIRLYDFPQAEEIIAALHNLTVLKKHK